MERLVMREYDLSLAQSLHQLSIEKSNRDFISDEVFETTQDAQKCISRLMECYKGADGPYVYALIRKADGVHVGHVEACRIGGGQWEIGYHIGEDYQRQGYATEAVRSFTPYALHKLEISQIFGICKAHNIASYRVLENCGYQLLEETQGRYLGQLIPIRRYVYRT